MTLNEFYFTCENISRDTEIILSLNYGTKEDNFVGSCDLRGTVGDFRSLIDTDKFSRLATILREKDIASFRIANEQQLGCMITTVEYVTFLDDKKSCKQEIARLFSYGEEHFEVNMILE